MANDFLIGALNQSATLKREVFELESGSVQSSKSLSISRESPFFAAVILEGFPNGTGSVTLSGTDSEGDSTSITLTFTGNQRRWDTDKDFKTITGYTTSGLVDEADGDSLLSIEAVSSSGQPIEELTTIKTINCRLGQTRLGEFVQATGGASVDSVKIYAYPSAGVRRNDQLHLDGDGLSFEIKAVKKAFDHLGRRSHDQCIGVAVDDSG